MNKCLSIFIFLLFLTLSFSAFGQVEKPQRVPDFRMGGEDKDRRAEFDDLILARQLMTRGAYLSAVEFLEDMYAKDPSRRETVSLLLDCYLHLKAASKAELLLQRLLEKYPLDYEYHIRLFELYLQSGVDSTVEKQINNMLDKYPGNPDIYRTIIIKLLNYGFNDKALSMIESGRVRFSNPILFALERAALFENRGDYRNAVKEYYTAAVSDSLLRTEADRKLALLLRYPGAIDEVIGSLKSILDSLPDDTYAMKILQEAYIRADRFEDAFGVSIQLDSLQKNDGRELFRYMRNCYLRKMYEQVIVMAEYVNEKNIEKNEISQYRFYYAEALEGVGRYRDAIEVYRSIKDKYPLNRDKARAALEIGNIYRYDMFEYDTARIYYDSAAWSFNIGPTRFSARLELARLNILKGQLDSAAIGFSGLLVEGGEAERNELVSYNLAMIMFYQKKFGEADLAFRKIIADFPRGYYTNDAIINSLIIREAQSSYPRALHLYAEAIYYEARLMPDSLVEKYKEIISRGQSSLTGLAMLRLAEHYYQFHDTSAALGVINQMAESYGDDYFFPYALKLKGEILSQNPDRSDKAAEIYRDLLQNFNSYPFTGEIREALQILENARPAS